MFKVNKNNQFSFNLENKLIHEKNDFLVSKCNQQAFNVIEQWPNWDIRKLILIGEKGCGKTHLSKIWQIKSNAIFFDIGLYKSKSYESIFKTNKHFVIENINSSIIKFKKKEKIEAEKYLLHFYNLIEEKKGYLILTDNISPKFWDINLPDLKSRVLSSPSVFIDQPDDNFLSLLLVKLFADKQILINKKIIKFIVNRSERSFTNLQLIVDIINKKSLTTKKKINLNFVKELI